MSWTKNDFKILPNAGFNLKYIEMAGKLKAAGFTLDDIAYVFSMSKSTISEWEKKHPLFKAAIDEGKQVAKTEILARAFRAACGYDYEESNEKFDEKGVLESRSVFHKHCPPNPKLIMWLVCNLSPDEWKSEHKILVDHEDTVHVKLDGVAASKQIESLAGKLFGTKDTKKKTIIETEAKNVD